MKVEDAATANTGRLDHVHRWSSLLYVGVGGDDDPRAAQHEPAVPRSMERAAGDRRARRPVRAATRAGRSQRVDGERMSTAAAVVLFIGDHRLRASSAAPTSAPGSGISRPAAPSAGARPRAVIDHSIGPVWEANHVWLIFVLVVLWTGFPRGVRVDHADAVRAADASPRSASCCGGRASRSARR